MYFRRGGGVELRPLLEEDVTLLLRWINDPEVNMYLQVYLPMMEADEREWIQNLHKQKAENIVFMIVTGGKPIGTMGLHGIDYRNRRATTGTLIGEKEYWGKGHGTKAKMLLLEYAFNTLNLRKVCSNAYAFNERSIRYSKRCGYREEGRLRQHHFALGKYWDTICLSVFKEDWEPLWEQFAIEHQIKAPM